MDALVRRDVRVVVLLTFTLAGSVRILFVTVMGSRCEAAPGHVMSRTSRDWSRTHAEHVIVTTEFPA